MSNKNIVVDWDFNEAKIDAARARLGLFEKDLATLEQQIAEAGGAARKAGDDLVAAATKPRAATEAAAEEWEDLEKEVTKTHAAAKRTGQQLEQAGKQGKKGAQEAERGISMLNKGLGSTASLIAGAFVFEQVLQFGKAIVDTVAEYQKFRAVLTNALGSEVAADAALAQIQEFAAKTPYSVAQITDSFVRLTNQGMKPTERQLRQMGDLAASTGKGFDQLTEAILDAAQGEGERLKEFGIKMAKHGDQVSFTFRGVKTTVDNTAASITNYITGLGDIEGVSGSMAAISETLGGKISNLGDAFDQLLISIGSDADSALSGGISNLTTLTQELALAMEGLDAKAKRFAQGEVSKLTADLDTLPTPGEVQARIGLLLAKLGEAQAAFRNANDAYIQADHDARNSVAGILSELSGGSIQPKAVEALRQDAANARAVVDRYALAIEEAYKRIQKLTEEGKDAAEKGILEQLRAQLKEETSNREKATSEAAILSHDLNIIRIQEEIQRLEDLGKQYEEARRHAEAMRQIGNVTVTDNTDPDKVRRQLEELDDQRRVAEQRRLDAQREAEAASLEKGREEFRADLEKRADLATNYEDKLRILRKDSAYFAAEITKTQAELDNARWEMGKQMAVDAANFYLQVRREEIQQELSDLQQKEALALQLAEGNEKERARIRNEFDAKERALLRQQANNEKVQAVFSIGLDTARAIMKTAAELGYPAALPFQAAAAAAGALQLSAALNKKLPGYFHGTPFVEGPGGIDQVPAMLTRGERVVTVGTNSAYKKSLDAIDQGIIAPNVLNQLIDDYLTHGRLQAAPAVIGGGGGFDEERLGRVLAEELGDRFSLRINVDRGGVSYKRGRMSPMYRKRWEE